MQLQWGKDKSLWKENLRLQLSGRHTRLSSDNPLTVRCGGVEGVFEFLLHSLTDRSAIQRYPQPTLTHKDYFKGTETWQLKAWDRRRPSNREAKDGKQRNYKTDRNKDRHTVWEAERERQLWTDLHWQWDRKNKHNSILLPTSKGLLQMSGQLDIRPAPASQSGLSAFLVLSAALKSWLSGILCNRGMRRCLFMINI